MTSTDEAFLLLSHADSNLRYAETTRKSGIYGPAVSMAYYAAFYAAQAVVAYHRLGPKTHKGVRKLFNRLAVHESDFPADVASGLARLAGGRLQADYDHETMDSWTDDQASEAIQRARSFVDEVNAWFRRHHHTDDHRPARGG